jgi:type IV pilus assembly protein PilF
VQPDTLKKITRFIIGLLTAGLIACASTGGNSAKSGGSENVHLQLGVRYLSLNKLEIAKENLQQALKDDSNNTQAHNALAFLYEKLNQFDDARDHYETALDLAPDDLGVQNNFGRFLCERGEFEKGMVLLVKASSDPLNDRAWLALTNAGRCQLAMEQKQRAEAYFRQALQSNNAYAPALLEMQKIAYQNGDFWAAKGYLQRYLGVASHTPETLWFAAQTERALGNNELAKEYKNLLLEKFPISNEATKIKSVLQ